MQKQRGFIEDTTRYLFDNGACHFNNGWAQFDTAQDASWYGNWVNPGERKLFSFAEGDWCVTTCETDEEFVAEIRAVAKWHEDNDGAPARIDACCVDAMAARFTELGLADLMH